VIRLVVGTLALFALVVAAVEASMTEWAAPFGIAVAVAGCLIVAVTDRPAR